MEGFRNRGVFRAALMRALDPIREKGAVGYLSDARKVKVIVHKDRASANEVWIPLLVAAGVKRFGLVTVGGGLAN
jgi:hypothetical protein